LFRPDRDKLSAVFSALGQRFFGPGGQAYVIDAIRQWRLFHDRNVSDVYLILDDNMATANADILTAAEQHGVILIKRSEIETPLWRSYQNVFYIQGYMHPGGDRKKGNQHFNQLVSERFFAIHALMVAKPELRHVLHFENDNMIFADMRRVVGAASACGMELGSLFANVKHVIPGVLYIRRAASIEALVLFIQHFLACGERFGRKFTPRTKDYANDMTYMMSFYQRFGRDALGALPAWEHPVGENCVADLLRQPEELTTYGMLPVVGRGDGALSHPKGVLFDLASFGQWYSFAYGRADDRPPLHVMQGLRGRFIDATPPPKLKWVRDEQGRKVPLWNGYRLLSLHVHAKNLRVFLSR
jgi:hypothetical protein